MEIKWLQKQKGKLASIIKCTPKLKKRSDADSPQISEFWGKCIRTYTTNTWGLPGD